MSDIKINVKPSICFKTGVIQIETKMDVDGVSRELYRHVCATQEEAIRKALMALGWMPPLSAYMASNGLLYEFGNLLNAFEADTVARRWGYMYAEQMVRSLEKKS